MSKPIPFASMMQMWRELLPDPAKPIATALKVGEKAWPKMKDAFGTRESPLPYGMPNPNALADIPVHVLVKQDWPPNLVAIIDQEGNAMAAWIVNA